MNRIQSSDKTLEIIRMLLKKFGITRLIDVTRLDGIGIPCYSATRPMGKAVCVSCGKGITHMDAKVSALMESIEAHFAENPDMQLIELASENELKLRNQSYIRLWKILHSASSIKPASNCYQISELQRIEWISGHNLITQKSVYIPACNIYYREPYSHLWTSNGLASGNNRDEAILHALYELIERDAFATFIKDRRTQNNILKIINPCTIPDKLKSLLKKFTDYGLDVYMLHINSCIDISTIVCIALSDEDLSDQLQVTMGLGTSIDAETAAIRAITECAQSRGAIIHGAREDIYWPKELSSSDLENASRMRVLLETNMEEKLVDWTIVAHNENKCNSLAQQDTVSNVKSTMNYVSNLLMINGHEEQYCAELTTSSCEISVVKLIIPTLKFDSDSMGI